MHALALFCPRFLHDSFVLFWRFLLYILLIAPFKVNVTSKLISKQTNTLSDNSKKDSHV